MEIPLQITFRNLPHSLALEERIRHKAGKLEALQHRVTKCRVTIEAQHRDPEHARDFTVQIDLRVPGDDIVVTRDHENDVTIALRDAFDVAIRHLDDRARTDRPDAKDRRELKRLASAG